MEKMYLKENLFFCILRFNLKMNNILIKKTCIFKKFQKFNFDFKNYT